MLATSEKSVRASPTMKSVTLLPSRRTPEPNPHNEVFVTNQTKLLISQQAADVKHFSTPSLSLITTTVGFF